MTKQELKTALKIAQSDTPLSTHETGIFNGFALKSFEKIVCTINQLAWLIRYQCVQMNGGIDGEALQCIAIHGKSKFSVL